MGGEKALSGVAWRGAVRRGSSHVGGVSCGRGQAATVALDGGAATVAGGRKRGRPARQVPARKRSIPAAPPSCHAAGGQKHDDGAAQTTAPNPAAMRGAKLMAYLRSDQFVGDPTIIWAPGILPVPLSSIRRFVEPVDSSSASTTSTVVHAYVNLLLQHRGRPSDVLENRKVVFLDRSWQAWLEVEDIYGSARQVGMRVAAGNKFLEYDMVFIPLLYDNHWILVVMNFDKLEFQVLDSCRKYGYKRHLSKLIKEVERCIVAANGARKEGIPLDIGKWEIRIIKRLPQQTDNTSCGIFMLKYMQLWNGTMLLEKFTQKDIASIKEEMAVELVFSELNTMNDVQAEIINWKLEN